MLLGKIDRLQFVSHVSHFKLSAFDTSSYSACCVVILFNVLVRAVSVRYDAAADQTIFWFKTRV